MHNVLVPRRILHVADNVTGGLGSFLTALIQRQARDGDEVTLAAPALPAGVVAPAVQHRRWEALARPSSRISREIRDLAAIVREASPEIVHLHSDKAGMAGRLLLRGRRPTVFQPHAWSFQAAPGWLRPVVVRWERHGARWTNAVVCVGEDERELGRAAGVSARYLVARNGIDLAHFAPAGAKERLDAREHLGLPPAVPIAVCVGRLHRQKNQHGLLDAWPMVRSRRSDALLALVGDGPERPALEGRSQPGVLVFGPTADIRPWLAAADVVVQPSLWEGLPLSVIEALASARSVVVTDIPGMREVVVDGVGARVKPEDTPALSAAILRRLADRGLADAEGLVGRGLVERRHDIREQHETISRLYDELLAGRRPGPR